MYFRLKLFLLCLCCTFRLAAQSTPSDDCGLHAIKPCIVHVAQDEAGIITSPLRVTAKDFLWIAPFGVATGLLLEHDAQIMRDLGINPSREDKFKKFSDYTTYGASAAPVVGYLVSIVKKDDYLQESSILAGEATLDAIILNQPLKYAIDRQRPYQGNGNGDFWPHGTSTWPDGQSMPSNHCMIMWSFARVIAGQYNTPATKITVYSLATAVTVSRVLARQHFPSDVVVGSTFGYLIGDYVFRHRSRQASLFSLSSVSTLNGKGVQLDINLGRR